MKTILPFLCDSRHLLHHLEMEIGSVCHLMKNHSELGDLSVQYGWLVGQLVSFSFSFFETVKCSPDWPQTHNLASCS